MKLLVIGKIASITHWLEDAVAAFRADGHQVEVGVTRDPRLHLALDRLVRGGGLGLPPAARIVRQLRSLCPDLVLVIGAFHVPIAMLEALAALPARPPMVGWVGDLFEPSAERAARALDAVAYTDSGLMALHQSLGFASTAFYLPHAVNPHGVEVPPSGERRNRMVFVANPTPHRRAVVDALSAPITLHGPAWAPSAGVAHDIRRGRLPASALRQIYGAHTAALNIRNEHHVLQGLNQRNFEPCLAGAAMVTDNQGDLDRCFDPGTEVLVWRDVDELNVMHGKLLREPDFAAAIGEAGRRRVLADHTYARRLEALRAAL